MLEIYSLKVDVEENGSIPFNNSKLAKGITAVQTAPATVQLNKKGVYMVTCSASITPAAAGDVSIQLAKNGVLQLGSFSIATAAADDTTPLSFTAFVQVSEDNQPCCCATNPTTIQLINTGEAGTFPVVRMVITKIC